LIVWRWVRRGSSARDLDLRRRRLHTLVRVLQLILDDSGFPVDPDIGGGDTYGGTQFSP
jgi:hypothetical protein